MTISNVTIHNVFTEGKLKAIASVVIDNFIDMVKDFGIVDLARSGRVAVAKE